MSKEPFMDDIPHEEIVMNRDTWAETMRVHDKIVELHELSLKEQNPVKKAELEIELDGLRIRYIEMQLKILDNNPEFADSLRKDISRAEERIKNNQSIIKKL